MPQQPKLSRADVEQLLERAKSVPAISFGYIRLAQDCLAYMDALEHRESMLVAVIYLWTRDAGMPANDETASYVSQHLDNLKDKTAVYSDVDRERLARAVLPASEEATDVS